MRISVHELAHLINGTIAGDGSRFVEKFAPIEEADDKSLSFISNPKYAHFLYTTHAAAVLVSRDFAPEKPTNVVLIHVDDVYTTMSSLLEQFSSNHNTKKGIEQPSYIATTATIGKDVYIGAFAYIGENAVIGDGAKIYPQSFVGDDARVGSNTIIYAGVKVYSGTEIGSGCILHSGCVLGSDGFGFAPQEDGTYKKIPQTGKVIVRDNVEIGANTTVDRATIKATIIEDGVKLDNLIQVAHNVEIGANTAIAAQTGISGSTKIGKSNMIGGQVGIVGHVTIADGSQIGAQSGVSRSISEKNQKWFGSPAINYKNAIKAQVIFKKLPELYDRIHTLEKAINKLNVGEKDE
jgi:UDP-3-O-[3-hydroxymyristoyl] glucosamine N-acyltransferase